MSNLELKVGKKPIKAYITAVIVHLKTGGTSVTVKARGRSVSKAVDVAEILKRFQETPMELGTIKIGTEEFATEGRTRRVSTIEISLSLKEASVSKKVKSK
jgi:DNA-binding protein